MKQSEGKFGVFGSPVGNNLFEWVNDYRCVLFLWSSFFNNLNIVDIWSEIRTKGWKFKFIF